MCFELPKSIKVRLSIQRALLGRIFPNMCAVVVSEENLLVEIYTTGMLGEEESEELSILTTEIAADFPDSSPELKIILINSLAECADQIRKSASIGITRWTVFLRMN